MGETYLESHEDELRIKYNTKMFRVKCLVHYEDLMESNSHLDIRRDGYYEPAKQVAKSRNHPTNSKRNQASAGAKNQEVSTDAPKPGCVGATRGRAQTKKKNISTNDILHDTEFIDTNDYVDDSMVVFLPEFCDRFGIDPVPGDPTELCKNFSLVVPDCKELTC